MSETTHASLDEALLAFQAEAPKLPRDGTNPHFKSKFTKLETVVERVVPLLTKHALVWKAKPSFDETSGEPTLKYKIVHAPSKEFDEGEMKLLLAKGDPQGQGSAVTYARRYALVSYLNLVADDDDDGNAASQGQRSSYGKPKAASGPRPISAAQKTRLKADITRHNLNREVMAALLKGAGVTLGDGELVNDVIARLTGAQASTLIDEIAQGAVPDTARPSDVPADASGFEHPPAGPDPDIGTERMPLTDPGVPS